MRPSGLDFTWLRALGAVLALAAPCGAQDVTTQFWPEIDTYVTLSEKSRLYVPLAKTREGTDDSDQDGTTGIYFDYYALPIAKQWFRGPSDAARSRRLLLRAGYGYTTAGDGSPATNTITGEATARQPLPWDILGSLRNRFDLNFTGDDFDPRYRARLKLERNVPIGAPSLTPYVYGEFFYSFDDGDWFRMRGTAGLELHIWERFVPEVYFQRDYNIDSSDVNGVGLVLSIYVR